VKAGIFTTRHARESVEENAGSLNRGKN
jgi:hypothetical protein